MSILRELFKKKTNITDPKEQISNAKANIGMVIFTDLNARCREDCKAEILLINQLSDDNLEAFIQGAEAIIADIKKEADELDLVLHPKSKLSKDPFMKLIRIIGNKYVLKEALEKNVASLRGQTLTACSLK